MRLLLTFGLATTTNKNLKNKLWGIMYKQIKKISLILALVAITSFGLAGCNWNLGIFHKEVAHTTEVQSKVVEYDGRAGQSVYDLLKANNDVQADTSSFGVMVKSINGLSQTDKEFWTYTVNGAMAEVGADKYITKDNDKVKWELKGF